MTDEGATALKLYNTLSRRKEIFQPIDPSHLRLYACGPTVYDDAHIGNARPVIVFDILFRLLRHLAAKGVWDGGKGETTVTYVRNITDIDDKINRRAFERWSRKRPLLEEVRALTETTTARFHDAIRPLGVIMPDGETMIEPRATEYVCDAAKPLDMVRFIARLIEKGHAYVAEGHVLFDVASMDGSDTGGLTYGGLSRRPLDEMIAGARVEVAPYKKNPTDFVLWKPSDPETEPGWDSPWGYGRPGWHIECSAMSGALLGETFDIHAGGIDLIFPHHENEIAQTCCFTGRPVMANVFMHNGFLQVEGQKMSKSLGNFVTIRELLETEKFGGRPWPGEVLRLAMLKTHYRQPIDWTVAALEEAEATLLRLSDRLGQAEAGAPDPELVAALCDDLNTPQVLARLHAIREPEVLAGSLQLLGLTLRPDALRAGEPVADGQAVGSLIEARLAARRAKNFAEADRIRDEITAMGIEIMDGKDPATGELKTEWRVKR